MKNTIALFAFVLAFSCMAFGQAKGRWASAADPVVREMAAKEKMWADSNCSPQPGLKDVIADDFLGTSPEGRRFEKSSAIETDTKSPDRECRFGGIKVQFFGENVALAYGEESSIRKGKDGKEAKRCLVWTDTWLKREGKWQIVAAHDNQVPCK